MEPALCRGPGFTPGGVLKRCLDRCRYSIRGVLFRKIANRGISASVRVARTNSCGAVFCSPKTLRKAKHSVAVLPLPGWLLKVHNTRRRVLLSLRVGNKRIGSRGRVEVARGVAIKRLEATGCVFGAVRVAEHRGTADGGIGEAVGKVEKRIVPFRGIVIGVTAVGRRHDRFRRREGHK